MEIFSSDLSESFHEPIQDSETKKRRVEDKLWEEAVSASSLNKCDDMTVVNEGSTSMDPSECKEVSPAPAGTLQ